MSNELSGLSESANFEASFNDITKLITMNAIESPNDIAVIFAHQKITYLEFENLSNKIAKQLYFNGIKKGDSVGILLERSVEMLASMVAILKCGAAYVPLELGYPANRIDYIMKDSNAHVLIISNMTKEKYQFNGKVMNVEDFNENQNEETKIEVEIEPNDIAYILYTSGTTGEPKGVMIEHKSIINLRNAMPLIVDFQKGDKIFSMTRHVFDVFLAESILSLSYGLKIILASDKELYNPRLLSKIIIKSEIDIIQMTPSTVQFLLNGDKELKCFKEIKQIILAGEVLTVNLRDVIKKCSDAQIYNFYGPTEATVYVTGGKVTDKEIIDIGKPLINYDIYIFNERDELDIEGELYIGGVGVARGYLNKEMQNKEKFVTKKITGNTKLYKTGDLVRKLPDGNLIYIKRLDFQVKLRGHRIELGEIEKSMTNYGAIRQAAAILKEGKNKMSYICAYYTKYMDFDVHDLRNYMKSNLPDYMIPTEFIGMEELPRNNAGKIDREALAQI